MSDDEAAARPRGCNINKRGTTSSLLSFASSIHHQGAKLGFRREPGTLLIYHASILINIEIELGSLLLSSKTDRLLKV